MDGTIYEATTEWIATQFSHHLVKFIIDIFILSNENLTVIREYNLFIYMYQFESKNMINYLKVKKNFHNIRFLAAVVQTSIIYVMM